MRSDAYRKLVADKKVHNILVSELELKLKLKEKYRIVAGKKRNFPESINKIIDDECLKCVKACLMNLDF